MGKLDDKPFAGRSAGGHPTLVSEPDRWAIWDIITVTAIMLYAFIVVNLSAISYVVRWMWRRR